MRSSFNRDDVSLLLKDITGMVEPMGTVEREKEIQRGRHYCEMLPIEYKPSDKYVEIYEHALKVFAQSTADAVVRVSEMIYRKKSGKVVLVSLVRAGTPIGILIKRYLETKYKTKIPHYSISIIRGKGIDQKCDELYFGRTRFYKYSICRWLGWKRGNIPTIERSLK